MSPSTYRASREKDRIGPAVPPRRRDEHCDPRALEIWETAERTAPPTWSDSPAETVSSRRSARRSARVRLAATSRHVRAAVEDRPTCSASRFASRMRSRAMSGTAVSSPCPAASVSPWATTRHRVVDEHLYNNLRPCDRLPRTTPRRASPGPTLSAMFLDATRATVVAGEFAFWPVDHPRSGRSSRAPSRQRTFVSVSDVTRSTTAERMPGQPAATAPNSSPWAPTCSSPPTTADQRPRPAWPRRDLPDQQFNQAASGDVGLYAERGRRCHRLPVHLQRPLWCAHRCPIGPNGIPQWSDPFDRPRVRPCLGTGWFGDRHPGGLSQLLGRPLAGSKLAIAPTTQAPARRTGSLSPTPARR